MKPPRNMDAPMLIKALQRLSYRVERQTGSHIRLSCGIPISHTLTIPNHSPLKVGTLAAIPKDVAPARNITVASLLEQVLDS
ncbi:MAG: type II toxin-antitoxin system HicA family toxin [Lysobacterales bacterium]